MTHKNSGNCNNNHRARLELLLKSMQLLMQLLSDGGQTHYF